MNKLSIVLALALSAIFIVRYKHKAMFLVHEAKSVSGTQDCDWCAGDSPFCAPTGECPSYHHVCNKTQYCCPDAKQCLTPTNRSCASDTACSNGEVCCPLTKICVKPSGVACKSTCDNNDEYCCPDALHCLTPTNPGVFCDPMDKDACSNGDVCCPLTKLCVKVGRPCTPAVADKQPFFLRKKQ